MLCHSNPMDARLEEARARGGPGSRRPGLEEARARGDPGSRRPWLEEALGGGSPPTRGVWGAGAPKDKAGGLGGAAHQGKNKYKIDRKVHRGKFEPSPDPFRKMALGVF